MLTLEQLDEIRKRCEAATPGPDGAFIEDISALLAHIESLTAERDAFSAAGYMRIPSVEELAMALYSVDDLAASIYGPDLMPWENRKEEVKEEYRQKARAMLEALGVKYGKGEAP